MLGLVARLRSRRLDLVPLLSLLVLFCAWLLAASFLSPVLLPSPVSVGMLQYYGEALQLGRYFAPLIATAALAVGLTHLTNWTERRMIRWKTSAF